MFKNNFISNCEIRESYVKNTNVKTASGVNSLHLLFTINNPTCNLLVLHTVCHMLNRKTSRSMSYLFVSIFSFSYIQAEMRHKLMHILYALKYQMKNKTLTNKSGLKLFSTWTTRGLQNRGTCKKKVVFFITALERETSVSPKHITGVDGRDAYLKGGLLDT